MRPSQYYVTFQRRSRRGRRTPSSAAFRRSSAAKMLRERHSAKRLQSSAISPVISATNVCAEYFWTRRRFERRSPPGSFNLMVGGGPSLFVACLCTGRRQATENDRLSHWLVT